MAERTTIARRWLLRMEGFAFTVAAGLVVALISHFVFRVSISVSVKETAPANHTPGTSGTSSTESSSTNSTVATPPAGSSGPIAIMTSTGTDPGGFVANSDFGPITGASPVSIDSVEETNGLSEAFYPGHSASVDFVLEGKYSLFTARVGMGDLSPNGCNVTYQITTPSGSVVYPSTMTGVGQAQSLSVPVFGLVRITLSSIIGGPEGNSPCVFAIGDPMVSP